MSEAKHTPGPWQVIGISQDDGSISIGQPEYRIVIAYATNAASFGDFINGAMKRGGVKFAQSDAHTQFANARLIAAGPDMLKAHQENSRLLKLVIHDLQGRVEAGKMAALQICADRSDEATRKATGAL